MIETRYATINALGVLDNPNLPAATDADAADVDTLGYISGTRSIDARALADARSAGLSAVNITLGHVAGSGDAFCETVRDITGWNAFIADHAAVGGQHAQLGVALVARMVGHRAAGGMRDRQRSLRDAQGVDGRVAGLGHGVLESSQSAEAATKGREGWLPDASGASPSRASRVVEMARAHRPVVISATPRESFGTAPSRITF